MLRVFNSKKGIIIGGVVFILLLMPIDSFAGEDWERITELPTKRWAFSSAVVDDKIYIIGGTLFENFRNGPWGLSTVEAYDPQTNTWQRLADMPMPREKPRAAVVNGIIYVFGGFSRKKGAETKHPVHVDAYDPRTDTWTRKGDMPVSRIYFGLGVVAGKVYLMGGNEGLDLALEQRMDRVDVYDPATDTWLKGPPKMPTRRAYFDVEVVSNRIYVIGGSGWPPAGWGPHLTVIEEYDPISVQWRKEMDMLGARFSFASVVVENDIYLIGGFSFADKRDLATVDVYNPQKEAWRNIPQLPTSMMPFSAAAVNGKIYVFGGYRENFEYLPDVLAFDTGFRAVEANGKLLTRWGELKGERKSQPRD